MSFAEYCEFQSTHPYRVRLVSVAPSLIPRSFQSTHPYRVRPLVRRVPLCPNFVSIHAPIQGATINSLKISINYFSFNPRTHTGCDLAGSVVFVNQSVSIHAPIQGATTELLGIIMQSLFQSTHPYRVRLRVSHNLKINDMFQSTHPYRVRHIVLIFFTQVCLVSIHAPIQGATSRGA